jgi:hypothetical protein
MPDTDSMRVTTVRLPAPVDARLDVLVAPVSARPPAELSATRVNKSSLLRLAILRGLEQLEREYPQQPRLPLDGAT